MSAREFAITLLLVMAMYQRAPQPELPLVEARLPLVPPTPTPCDANRTPPPVVLVRAVPCNRPPAPPPERTA